MPYEDGVLVLTDEDLVPLSQNQPWKRELFIRLSARFRQDPEPRLKPRAGTNPGVIAEVCRDTGLNHSKRDWMTYLIGQ